MTTYDPKSAAIAERTYKLEEELRKRKRKAARAARKSKNNLSLTAMIDSIGLKSSGPKKTKAPRDETQKYLKSAMKYEKLAQQNKKNTD